MSVTECGTRDGPLHPWEWPEKRWSWIHIDHAGPFMGELFLMVIDAYSKWIEVYHPALVQPQLLRNSAKLSPIMGYLKWLSQIMVQDLSVKNLQILWPGMKFYM